MLKSAGMKRRGFTIIEFVVILVILGVLAIFSFLSISPYRAVKLEAAAKKVVADLLFAKNLALSTSKWYGVSFEADPVNTYRVYLKEDSTVIPVEDPSQLGKDFVVDLYDYYSGVRIASVSIGGGNRVEFHPLGTPYNDKGGSAIVSTGEVTLSYRGYTRAIYIMPNTGRIVTQ